MPTGYTSDLYEGKDVTVSDFILGCARAFGALVTMRDEPLDAPIPEEFEPSSYHADKIAEAEATLREMETISAGEMDRRAQADYRQALKRWQERRHEAAERRQRYEDMLEQVQQWRPPTAEHVGLQKFMVDQLEQSIKFDCSMDYDNRPALLTPAQWLIQQSEKAQHDIEYHRREHEKEVERATERSRWVKALRESLPVTA